MFQMVRPSPVSFSGQQFEEIQRNVGSLKTPRLVQIPPNRKVVVAVKSLQIVQYLVSDTLW